MHVVTFHRPVHSTPFTYAPNTRYLINESQFRKMMEKDPTIEARVSIYNAYEKRYAGQDLNGKRLLLYRPKSIGDQLITSALVYYLKTRFPNSTIDYYCDPSVVELWEGIPIHISPTPINFEAANRYDYTLFLEGLYENNMEPDQDDCYTTMFRYAGFNDVPVEFKKPALVFKEEELKPKREGEYLFVQWDSSALYRSYTPTKLAALCAHLAEKVHVVIGGLFPYPYVHHTNVTDLRMKTRRFRDLAPWVANASCVLCPDSSIGHLAACFPHVPVVSLWGSYNPNTRVKTYPNHHPLVAAKVCPFSPCHHGLLQEPPIQFCSKASNYVAQDWSCAQLRAIEPEVIEAKIMELLPKDYPHDDGE